MTSTVVGTQNKVPSYDSWVKNSSCLQRLCLLALKLVRGPHVTCALLCVTWHGNWHASPSRGSVQDDYTTADWRYSKVILVSAQRRRIISFPFWANSESMRDCIPATEPAWCFSYISDYAVLHLTTGVNGEEHTVASTLCFTNILCMEEIHSTDLNSLWSVVSLWHDHMWL